MFFCWMIKNIYKINKMQCFFLSKLSFCSLKDIVFQLKDMRFIVPFVPFYKAFCTQILV